MNLFIQVKYVFFGSVYIQTSTWLGKEGGDDYFLKSFLVWWWYHEIVTYDKDNLHVVYNKHGEKLTLDQGGW